MNKKLIKLLSVMLIVVTIVTVSTSVFAVDFDNISGAMKNSAANTDTNTIAKTGGSIMGILQTVGMVLSIIVLIVLGIKYMMGSAEEKAEYKKTMLPYLIGAIIIFAASALAGVVVNFANGI